jgi:flagellar protein FliS
MIDDSKKPDRLERFTPTLVVNQPDKVYRQASVETASPGRLVVMFYDRLLRELRSGLSAMEQGVDTADSGQISPEARSHFQMARNLLNALTQSIDYSTGEIADNLTSLYLVFYRQILEAELEKDATRIEKILPSIEELKAAWEEIAAKSD